MPIPTFLCDSYLFVLLQGLLGILLILAIFFELRARFRAGSGATKLGMNRGEKSMRIFYGIYVAVSGVLVVLCVSVDCAKDYRVFLVLIDTAITSYLCLENGWSRNKLVAIASWLPNIEAH